MPYLFGRVDKPEFDWIVAVFSSYFKELFMYNFLTTLPELEEYKAELVIFVCAFPLCHFCFVEFRIIGMIPIYPLRALRVILDEVEL